MVSGSQHVTVGLDAESKRYMTRLTTAIDALAKAINNGEKVDKDLISEPVVQRLVEDTELRMAGGGYTNSGAFPRDSVALGGGERFSLDDHLAELKRKVEQG